MERACRRVIKVLGDTEAPCSFETPEELVPPASTLAAPPVTPSGREYYIPSPHSPPESTRGGPSVAPPATIPAEAGGEPPLPEIFPAAPWLGAMAAPLVMSRNIFEYLVTPARKNPL